MAVERGSIRKRDAFDLLTWRAALLRGRTIMHRNSSGTAISRASRSEIGG